jgi:hypothetical protein
LPSAEPIGADFVEPLGFSPLGGVAVLALAAVAQLIEHADLPVGVDNRLATPFDFLFQARCLLGQRAALAFEYELIALCGEHAIHVEGAAVDQLPLQIGKPRAFRVEGGSLVGEDLLRPICFGQPHAKLVASDLAESLQRLESKAESCHGIMLASKAP